MESNSFCPARQCFTRQEVVGDAAHFRFARFLSYLCLFVAIQLRRPWSRRQKYQREAAGADSSRNRVLTAARAAGFYGAGAIPDDVDLSRGAAVSSRARVNFFIFGRRPRWANPSGGAARAEGRQPPETPAGKIFCKEPRVARLI